MDIGAAFVWLTFNIISIGFLAFYSMLEMACVSFNKIRLQYYVSKGNRHAIWLNTLLQQPSKLFGTTLIGVNVATFVGSECAREFHSALGINPDWAPLSQVLLVIVLGELAPMFAARHYAEHVAMTGVPLIYASARLMTPILWILHQITSLCQKLIGGKQEENDIYLSQEEIQKIFEPDTEKSATAEGDALKAISFNIFNLKHKEAGEVMTPLNETAMLPANSSVGQIRELLESKKTEFVLLYHNTATNIVGVAWARDLIRVTENKKAREFARAPWLITSSTKLMLILKQFKRNRQNVAIILDSDGHAIGVLDLDDVLEEIFRVLGSSKKRLRSLTVIEKTLPGDLTIGQFNSQFHVNVPADPAMTLGELVQNTLGHHPEKGESIFLDPYEFTVKETSLMEIKTIAVKTHL